MIKYGTIAGLAAFAFAGMIQVAAPATDNKLPEAAQAALHAALDDEYKAHATYQAVIEKFGEVRPFANIIRAEQRHISFLKPLFAKYGLNVPPNPYLSGDKRPKAPATLVEACRIGVQAEIANAALYDEDILPAVKNYADIADVAILLRDASRNNHLSAFQRCVDRGGRMGPGAGMGGQG
jgi:hypothetical protein